MAKYIKLYDGYKVTVDDTVKEFREHNWNDVMDYINMFDDKNLRDELFRELFCFHKLNLSEYYNGHYVCITLIPTKD